MADIQLDTIDALMARYAAGILPEPARVLVEAHLQMQSANRPKVAEYETVVGDILENMEPVSLTSRDAALRAIFMAAPLAIADAPSVQPANRLFPKAILDFAGHDAADIPWKRKLPGFKEYSLGKIDGCDVSFFWLKPGRVIPAHTHEGYELSLVLDGAFNDTRGRFAKGDISVADESIDHRPVAEAECPCIGFAVSQAPVKLTGSWRQLLGDMIG
ncbi:cupin domain-containing protein [Rhizobium sp. PL01]|jgi:putative transcriptional regulator|uniref:cupin domain-containing protein n=1 Tax=Rhizobium sp. PL01 TaxID=3085631 RepID=UPI002980C6CE|nr:cupin domain-containing protein [Rhizobium sp. PL01]MDW5313625.1 cupin domain-containing protein [Rhizobium sp. PL01]